MFCFFPCLAFFFRRNHQSNNQNSYFHRTYTHQPVHKRPPHSSPVCQCQSSSSSRTSRTIAFLSSLTQGTFEKKKNPKPCVIELHVAFLPRSALNSPPPSSALETSTSHTTTTTTPTSARIPSFIIMDAHQQNISFIPRLYM